MYHTITLHFLSIDFQKFRIKNDWKTKVFSKLDLYDAFFLRNDGRRCLLEFIRIPERSRRSTDTQHRTSTQKRVYTPVIIKTSID